MADESKVLGFADRRWGRDGGGGRTEAEGPRLEWGSGGTGREAKRCRRGSNKVATRSA